MLGPEATVALMAVHDRFMEKVGKHLSTRIQDQGRDRLILTDIRVLIEDLGLLPEGEIMNDFKLYGHLMDLMDPEDWRSLVPMPTFDGQGGRTLTEDPWNKYVDKKSGSKRKRSGRRQE